MGFSPRGHLPLGVQGVARVLGEGLGGESREELAEVVVHAVRLGGGVRERARGALLVVVFHEHAEVTLALLRRGDGVGADLAQRALEVPESLRALQRLSLLLRGRRGSLGLLLRRGGNLSRRR